MKKIEKSIHADMLIQASGTGPAALIGKVVGLKQHHYIKLSKHDTPDGKRRYIPLVWVRVVKGDVVYLSKSAAAVRHGWLDKAAIKAQIKAQNAKAQDSKAQKSGSQESRAQNLDD